ncbi:MAG: S-adenosylmethionine:tRNA ribosyltransferase-isomerase [Muribaculaceae bacterium]|jgi:S-adenosylmethionine:tRNA ribosyltransferase-isomerase|nr:S-adenosylmethionine:tRNA ribosyltransferase-isomerase [Muribaculaceae bacterium]
MNIKDIQIKDFNYPLPDERIAKHPLTQREQCKLLVYQNGDIQDLRFYDVPRLLPQQSMLVYNNTRVINARLRFQKPNAGAIIEIFCLEPIAPRDYAQVFQTTNQCSWLCFVGNSKRWKAGSLTQVVNVNGCEVELAATRGEQKGNAFEIIFSWNNDNITFASLLEAIGEIPIPPYLNRNTEESDSADYQTVYSHIEGSVAAPTAGLHFTDEVLAECDRQGISRRELTLHVGAGTFQPVKSESIGEHDMHTEFISVEKSLLVDLIKANGNVIAVGTTSVRTLESLYYIGITLLNNPDANEEELRVKQWAPYQQDYTISTADALQAIIDHLDRNGIDRYIGSTQIMIAPSFKFRVIRGMITNFHQPQSTLLLLVSAFVDGNWKAIYDYALSHNYRFLSYGDSSLLLR